MRLYGATTNDLHAPEKLVVKLKGENFKLVGGTGETHGAMQEKAIKMNEHLKQRGKELEDISREEFRELADKLEMPLLDVPRTRQKN